MRLKNKVISIRVSDTEYYIITQRAKEAKKTITDFLIASAFKQKITVINDLNSFRTELNRIGNNLNQLTVLAQMNKITAVDLTQCHDEIGKITNELCKITASCS